MYEIGSILNAIRKFSFSPSCIPQPVKPNVNRVCPLTVFHLSNFIMLHQPNLMFIHFDSIDDAGHGHGWGSPDYYDAVKVTMFMLELYLLRCPVYCT